MDFDFYSEQAEKLADATKYSTIATNEYLGRVRQLYFEVADANAAGTDEIALTRVRAGWRVIDGAIKVNAAADDTPTLTLGHAPDDGTTADADYLGTVTLAATAGILRLGPAGVGMLAVVEKDGWLYLKASAAIAAGRTLSGYILVVHD